MLNARAPTQSATAITSFAPEDPLALGASSMSTPPALAPALYASHSTANSAMALAPTIIHRVEFKRPFINFLHHQISTVLVKPKSQMTGTGNVSVNFFKFKANANRSSCRNMPQQCGTSRGASSTSNGSDVLHVPI